jgi:two-component system NarL family sensor kinase
VPAATLLLQVLRDGPLPGTGWRLAAALAVLANVLAPVAWALTPYDEQDQPVPAAYGAVTNPVGVDGAWGVVGISLLLVLVSAALGIASLVVRLRRSAGRERDQVLWVHAGALGTLLLSLGWAVPSAQTAFIAAALLPLPAAIAWALARTRLWDLDLALGRTLVYLTLSLLVLAVYGLLLLLASTFLGRLTGRSDLLVFAIAAVLVQPAHTVLERGVNRLLYGDVIEPQVAVTELGRRVDSATAPSQVLPGVVEVLARTLRLPYVSLHLPRRYPVTHGDGPGADVETLSLVHQDRTVGTLDVELPAGGLGPRRGALLDEMLRQTAQAAHAVLLQEELQGSRESVVASREEERRRLRHDLHDDLGPALPRRRCSWRPPPSSSRPEPTGRRDAGRGRGLPAQHRRRGAPHRRRPPTRRARRPGPRRCCPRARRPPGRRWHRRHRRRAGRPGAPARCRRGGSLPHRGRGHDERRPARPGLPGAGDPRPPGRRAGAVRAG